MAQNPPCSECDKEIAGEVVWYRPFGEIEQESSHMWRFISRAGDTPLTGHQLPFHPACFEKRTGHKGPVKVAHPPVSER
jgi:hypothetical protein